MSGDSQVIKRRRDYSIDQFVQDYKLHQVPHEDVSPYPDMILFRYSYSKWADSITESYVSAEHDCLAARIVQLIVMAKSTNCPEHLFKEMVGFICAVKGVNGNRERIAYAVRQCLLANASVEAITQLGVSEITLAEAADVGW